MEKHYFELDKIESITLTSESVAAYRWFPEIPAKEKSFMGIKFGMHKAVPGGWNDMYSDETEEEFRDYLRYRKPTSYFEDTSRKTHYRVCDITKRIYNKAHVSISLGYKRSFGLRFDSDAEAQAWVDKLVSNWDEESKQETLEEAVNAFKKTNVYTNEIKQKQERSYSEEEMLEFSEWVSHNDWVYLPSKGYWVNEEQEESEQKFTTKQLFKKFKKQ